MQSNGGISTIENSSELPIGLLLSGPAGGVIGGRWTGEHCGKNNIITIDIGGTSADISVDRERRAAHQEPARHRGRRPAGAGADDRHRRDRRRRRLDRLYRSGRRVPRRPALGGRRCPGRPATARAATEPTVTDAQVVLGRMDPEQFLGGDLTIDASLSREGDPRRTSPSRSACRSRRRRSASSRSSTTTWRWRSTPTRSPRASTRATSR